LQSNMAAVKRIAKPTSLFSFYLIIDYAMH